MKTGKRLGFEEFFSNFSLIASEFKREETLSPIGNTQKTSWNRIKFKPCNEMEYTKNFPAEITAWWHNNHFCPDTSDLNIYGGKPGNFQVLNVDLYDCIQSESPVQCNQTIQPQES